MLQWVNQMADKKRILIVDDQKDVTEPLKFYLEKAGYEVRAEYTGKGALSATKAFMPNLILLDIVMPDVDGGDVASEIREDATVKVVPIVFLTAAVTKEEVDAQGGVVGGKPILSKLTKLSTLVECIELYLR